MAAAGLLNTGFSVARISCLAAGKDSINWASMRSSADNGFVDEAFVRSGESVGNWMSRRDIGRVAAAGTRDDELRGGL